MSAPVAGSFLARVFDAALPGGVNAPSFPVFNPATGVKITQVADMGPAETEGAIAKAYEAQKLWAKETAKARAKLLMAWYDLILEHQEDLAQLLTLEMGKPLVEARGEIGFGATFIEWFAEEGKRLYGDIIPTNMPGRRLMVLKQPIGVVAAITPWNFPNAMITRKIAPALAAGCSCVLKPAEDTPLSAVALAILADDAGLPDGLINIITAQNAPAVAKVLTEHPDVRKLSFTGSTRVGKLLMKGCADSVKKVSLELGGNAPFIVFEDADIDAAVQGALLSKYRNAGQTCVSSNRFYIHENVFSAFAEKLTAVVDAMTVGDGMGDGTTVGPLINNAALTKVLGLVKGALDAGAKAVTGGGVHPHGENYFEPTILVDAKNDMEIAQAEIFGPVAVLYSFKTEEEVILSANDTPYGLAAYCYTRDMARCWRMSEALEYGMVAINEGTVASEAAPFGGVKQSGIGREGSKYGLDDFTEIKCVSMAGIGG